MANLNIRVDDALKAQVEAVLDDIGMSLSTAATVFFKQVVRYNGIPLNLKADPFYSSENRARLLEAAKRMETHGGTIHGLIEDADV
jgi:DNA-damage-inducible protein J